MDKIIKRVSKCGVASTLAILLAIFATGCSKAEEVKVVPPYAHPQIEKKLEDMRKQEIEKQEAEAREKRIQEAIRKAEAMKKAELKKKQELEKIRLEQLKAKEKAAKAATSYAGSWNTYTLTHYVATCKGCSGVTATGIDVRSTTKYQGYRVLSVDPKRIPLGSIVEIKDGKSVYKAIAVDTGGAIKGNKLDLLVGSYKEAIHLGKKKIQLRIVRKGW